MFSGILQLVLAFATGYTCYYVSSLFKEHRPSAFSGAYRLYRISRLTGRIEYYVGPKYGTVLGLREEVFSEDFNCAWCFYSPLRLKTQQLFMWFGPPKMSLDVQKFSSQFMEWHDVNEKPPAQYHYEKVIDDLSKM